MLVTAGSDTVADHIEAVKLALAQLPEGSPRKVLVRAGAVRSICAPA